MTTEDLDNMEEALGFALPKDYREVMLAYPFYSGNGGNRMLSNEPVHAADPFRLELVSPDVARPFIIGWVPKKRVFYMDADRHSSPVFVRDLKKGLKWEFSPSLATYVQRLTETAPRYEMNWRSHAYQFKAYALCLGLCGASAALLAWTKGTDDLDTIFRICAIIAAVMILPALLVHLWYAYLSMGVKLERTEHGSFAITQNGQVFIFIPQEMQRLVAYKSLFLVGETSRRSPWDRLHYYDLDFKDRSVRLTSLVVEDLERVLRMPPEKVVTKARFMPIP